MSRSKICWGRDPVAAARWADEVVHRGQKQSWLPARAASIGAELCRQALRQRPRKLVLFERSEFALYQIERELHQSASRDGCEIVPVLGDVRHRGQVDQVLVTHHIDSIYHAAAYKHVPLVEKNVLAAVDNNVFGTLTVAHAALENGVANFSADLHRQGGAPEQRHGRHQAKVCEMIIQALAVEHPEKHVSMVRFGNVLGFQRLSDPAVPRADPQRRAGDRDARPRPPATS